jgi:hypothetical protein
MLTQLIGSSVYLAFWNPDFLYEALGKKGTCARYYPDKRTAVDVGNPQSRIALRKQELLSQLNYRYICLPER